VLPYLAGDSLLLAGASGLRTLGIAVGSDVFGRRRDGRVERLFRQALGALTAVWAVSDDLAAELERCGRTPDWVAPVGVDVAALPPVPSCVLETRGRLLSARREAPIYRRSMIREAARGLPGLTLVEAADWSRGRLLAEMQEADVVMSFPATDGAPATVMEALSVGSHVVASGGGTVRDWLRRFGGSYGEPGRADEARTLIEEARARALRETAEERRARAEAARQAFDRNLLLQPLLRFVRERASGHAGRRARTTT
jgi:hypothetical protein